MIQRVIAIIESLAGGTVSNELMLRVADAFLPIDVDPTTVTNEDKAANFVREMRRMTKLRVLQSEEERAAEIARLAARDDVNSGVDLGSD
jgi:hypothetical protein